MTRRTISLIAVVVVPLALLSAAIATDAPLPGTASFAASIEPTPPYVPRQEYLSATWFCGGVPLEGRGVADGGRGGVVVVANALDTPLDATLTVFTSAPDVTPVERRVVVPAREAVTIDLAEFHTDGDYVAAMVEILGGGGIVEQRADHEAGSAVSPCSNSTSDTWFLADNYTLNDSREDLVIVNPFPDRAILDISFATPDGRRTPQALQGLPVAGRSISVVSEDAMPKDEIILAADVRASRGRVVVARAQRYRGERNGFSLTLAAPAASPEWYFADGESGGDVAFERYSIYNPSERDVTVDATVFGVTSDEFIPARSDVIPAGSVISYTTKAFENLPEGRHFIAFSTQSDDGIVVERGITRTIGDAVVTAVCLGSPQVFLGYYRWSTAVGTDIALDAVLIVANLDFLPGEVTVKVVGPGGEVAIPGLELVELPAAGVIAIPITDATALGLPLVVESTTRIVVERSLARASDLRGRSASLALPG